MPPSSADLIDKDDPEYKKVDEYIRTLYKGQLNDNTPILKSSKKINGSTTTYIVVYLLGDKSTTLTFYIDVSRDGKPQFKNVDPGKVTGNTANGEGETKQLSYSEYSQDSEVQKLNQMIRSIHSAFRNP